MIVFLQNKADISINLQQSLYRHKLSFQCIPNTFILRHNLTSQTILVTLYWHKLSFQKIPDTFILTDTSWHLKQTSSLFIMTKADKSLLVSFAELLILLVLFYIGNKNDIPWTELLSSGLQHFPSRIFTPCPDSMPWIMLHHHWTSPVPSLLHVFVLQYNNPVQIKMKTKNTTLSE